MSDEPSIFERMGLKPGQAQETKPANGRAPGGDAAPPPPGRPAPNLSTSGMATSDMPTSDMYTLGLSSSASVVPPSAASSPQPGGGAGEPTGMEDLAEHFLGCAKLGRYLTVADNSRFIITDDFRASPIIPEASAMAAIFSKDYLVAQAALLPLSERAQRMTMRERDRLERLFALIEEQTLSDGVRTSAQAIREHHFRAAEIRALEAELGERMSPARLRYRHFLDVVKKLMDRKITAGPFLDEFRGFTQEVAGRLDFGIYSFCLDRLFGSVRVPMKVKKLLILELLKYPAQIRRELLSNVLVFPGQVQELIDFIRYMVTTELGQSVAIEIELLEAFKQHRLSMSDIESSLARAAS
ncbi:MAG: hypothetical protein HOH04_11435 [Rhodospirillaceae bacterium]|nr:hypothetical protein [Rhodospirillaceae bacterium]